jgi:hypothetical protein
MILHTDTSVRRQKFTQIGGLGYHHHSSMAERRPLQDAGGRVRGYSSWLCTRHDGARGSESSLHSIYALCTSRSRAHAKNITDMPRAYTAYVPAPNTAGVQDRRAWKLFLLLNTKLVVGIMSAQSLGLLRHSICWDNYWIWRFFFCSTNRALQVNNSVLLYFEWKGENTIPLFGTMLLTKREHVYICG